MDTGYLFECLWKVLYLQFLWFGLWGLTYVFFRDPKYSADFKNRMISIVHGLTSLGLSIYELSVSRLDFTQPNSLFLERALLLSVAYFIYDFIGCGLVGILDEATIIHHIMSTIGMGNSLLTKSGGSFVYYGVFIGEVSNFPMHVRKMLEDFELRHTLLHEVLENIYFFLYIAARSFLLPHCLILGFLNHKYVPIFSILVCLLLGIQSWLFIRKMVKIIKKKLAQRQERNAKKVSLWWFSVNPEVNTKLEYPKQFHKEKIF
jgi:hypothetical protein